MNKTLSEQICEVCGIEPQYWCSYHDTICPIQDAGKFNPTCPKQAVTKECDARSSRMQYPDFENNNNNFVKLLEVLYKEIGLYDLFFITDNNRKQLKLDILKTIVELLSNKLGYKITLITKIKKIIRETDWEI